MTRTKQLRRGNPKTWSAADVAQWLRSQPKLSMYAESFEAKEINGAQLADLSEQDLSEYMKIQSPFARKELLAQIAALYKLIDVADTQPPADAKLPQAKRFHYFG